MEIEISDKIIKILSKMSQDIVEQKGVKIGIEEMVESAILMHYKIASIDLKLVGDDPIEISILERVKTNYVYVYLNPLRPGNFQYENFFFEFEPFYVGKGSGERCYQHNTNSKNEHMKIILQELKEKNTNPIIIKLKENLHSGEAYVLENHLINLIGRIDVKTGSLCNLIGGMENSNFFEPDSSVDLETNAKLNIIKAINSHRTIEEAAKALGISARTLFRKKKEMKIKKIKNQYNLNQS